MITAELEKNEKIWLWTAPGHDHVYRDRIRSIPGSLFDSNRHQWNVRRTWASCVQLRGLFGPELGVGPALNAWALLEMESRVVPSMYWRGALAIDGSGLDGLYPFQRAGVAFLVTARQALLADDPGAGKTVQLAVTLGTLSRLADYPSPFPCLIVCPKSIKKVWEHELAKWLPDASVQVVSGNVTQRREAIASGADILVVNYETARDHSRLHHYGSIELSEKDLTPKELNGIEWSTVILDEAHRCKEPATRWTRACWYLGKNTNYRYALTGTPIANHPGDLWSIMHFVAPDEHPVKTKYVDRYCLQSWGFDGGFNIIGINPTMTEEFFRILDPRMRRMPKELVLKQLPPKVREIRWCEMTPKQAKAYKEMQKTMVSGIDPDGVVVATDPMTRRLREMQFASAYAVIDEAGKPRLSTPSSKIDELIEFLEDIGDEPAVVFAQSRQLIMLAIARLDKEGITHREIVGGMTEDERARHEREFMSGHARIMLGTTGAAGEGLTLTRSRHVVFLQRSDKLIENIQAENRCHRIGSEHHESIVITDFISQGTVEEKQVVTLAEKMERLEQITRDRQVLLAAAQQGDQVAAQRMKHLEDEERELRAG